jgi:hypothetical protein
MACKNIICTLDVETTKPTGKDKFPRVYDLGYLIHDNKGNILQERSFIILEGFERFLQEGFSEYVAFYAKKAQTYYMPEMLKYYMGLTTKKWQPVTMAEARETMYKDFEKYKVNSIQAYNASFDKRELETAWKFLGNTENFLPDFPIYDIWSMAVSVIGCTPTYLKWCDSHNLYTEKGNNPKTSAEALYSFIVRDENFQESHTGLEDCHIEKDIYLACVKKHKKMRKDIYAHPWRTMAKYAKERKCK